MIAESLAAAIASALERQQISLAPSDVHLERPARAEHGDLSTNAALATAKTAGRNPREVAQQLADDLLEAARDANASQLRHLIGTEVAGPGFVNLRLAPGWLHDVLARVVELGVDRYAAHDDGAGKTASIEFVSANPTGPLHAGGGRWAAYGDSLARLFRRCGWKTRTEYYVNDAGRQMLLFGESLLARLTDSELPEDGYHGSYVTEWAAEMPADLNAQDAARWGCERALAEVREVLGSMNVRFDHWQHETELISSGEMQSAVDRLDQAGFIYEADGARWLATTRFGDDKDRVLYRSDGQHTYFVPDIAYHHKKFAQSYGAHTPDLAEVVINVLGADHHGYVARMRAALLMLGHDAARYEAIVGQNVTLLRDGRPVELGKRTGTIVEVAELLDAVGPDATRLAYLQQSIDTPQTIDIDLLTKQANDNPVYYVQYAHARIASVGRQAASRAVVRPPLAEVDLAVLTDARELAVLRLLEDLPQVVLLALDARAPHRIAGWLRDLAGAFHGFYHDCPMLREDVARDVRDARLWLTEATRIGLVIGLDLLGVDAPEQM